MNKIELKTNVKCSACVEKIAPFLNDLVGRGKWSVDLTDPQRTLRVDTPANLEEVKAALAKAGYKGEGK
jgi:copper chaperone CopZ